jgi:hypothetical protein
MDNHSKDHANFKQFEYKAYKKIHKVVLADEGIPNLKKRAYQMPGYRKILDKDEKNYYEKALSKQHQNTIDRNISKKFSNSSKLTVMGQALEGSGES